MFGELWRRSLQVRVVTSTLALSTAVVFVLGMVLQNEIIARLVTAKQQAAVAQTGVAQRTVSSALRGADDSSVANLQSSFAGALASLTTASTAAGPVSQQPGSSAAGAFVPILVQSSPGQGNAQTVSVGPYLNIPQSLRLFVQNGQSGYQMTTVATSSGQQIFLVVGAPINVTFSPSVQLYLMFPMSTEQNTIGVVQEDLVLGGLVLVLLLAGITNLVIRQVVRPVRNAAEIAERFAEGHLDERMRVIGEDDVARLAESYNQMAESIQAQIHQLEDFGQLQRRFTSDVSHELRTPLTTVRMAADVLHASREQFPSGLSRSTELLVDELDRFEALLGDLLEISRLDAGVEDLASDQVDVRGLARSAVNSVQGLV
ncbi:MAG TPA: HAMP domain-containing sensor histidine kinase, partial [Pseudonocardiaceae bacterium]